MSDEKKTDQPAAPAAQPQRAPEFPVDVTGLSTVYANFARVTGTPEELVLDFGLNTSMVPVPTEPVKLSHRLVMNYFSAKRLLFALSQSIQRHEAAYGVLEIDINKRVKGGNFQRPGGVG